MIQHFLRSHEQHQAVLDVCYVGTHISRLVQSTLDWLDHPRVPLITSYKLWHFNITLHTSNNRKIAVACFSQLDNISQFALRLQFCLFYFPLPVFRWTFFYCSLKWFVIFEMPNLFWKSLFFSLCLAYPSLFLHGPFHTPKIVPWNLCLKNAFPEPRTLWKTRGTVSLETCSGRGGACPARPVSGAARTRPARCSSLAS